MIVNRLQNGLINSSIAPWTSRVNCQKKFFQMGLHIFFFLVILIEIFILKTTMYHKYTLKYQKFHQKNVKNATIVYVPFCAKHWRHICAIPHVIICHLFFQLHSDRDFYSENNNVSQVYT
jgi:hypothetical protein